MSFSAETKRELSRVETEKKCCAPAEIAGFIRVCGLINMDHSGEVSLKLTTENPAIARLYLKKIRGYFKVHANLHIGKSKVLKKGHTYEIAIDGKDGAEQILREVGILRVKEGYDYIASDIYEEIIKRKCCKKAYLRGVFIGAGTISDPEKGYHLEMVVDNEILASDLRRLINSFGLRSKIVKRRKHYVVYLKEAEQIIDFLNILGAHGQLLEIENIRILKDIRNRTNRIVNCESANLDKTVNTAYRQIESIKTIEKLAGLDSLSPRLAEAADLRLKNPQASLEELASMTNPPVKKSGIYHRLRKIDEIAEKLRKGVFL
ncbi:MAG: DNA-binding protein WhiA [Anaerovoracaceae bacterium]|jgi:DNA-binding protein WhiA